MHDGRQQRDNALEFLNKLEAAFQGLGTPLPGDPFYYIRETMVGAHGAAAPFELGARVELQKTPDFKRDAPGWKGAEHFLVRGCTGFVRDLYMTRSGYRVGFEPDNQTYISQIDGKPTAVKDPGVYYFRAEDLRRMPHREVLLDARPVELRLDKLLATFHVPQAGASVELWTLENQEYRVIKVEPYPPPTRGDKVTSTDCTTKDAALWQAARYQEELWNDARRVE
jgi:hypothetical protein